MVSNLGLASLISWPSTGGGGYYVEELEEISVSRFGLGKKVKTKYSHGNYRLEKDAKERMKVLTERKIDERWEQVDKSTFSRGDIIVRYRVY